MSGSDVEERRTVMFDDNKFHIIPSVRNLKNLDVALDGKEEWILLSCCHIGNLRENVARCHRAGKKVVVNHEIVGGLGADKMAFQLLKRMFQVDGVMGSGSAKIGNVSKENMKAIRRIALIDSLSVEHALKSLKEVHCDAIELRPSYYGVRYLKEFIKNYPCHYVAGGFVDNMEELEQVYSAGFSGVMTSCVELWNSKLSGKIVCR